MIHVVRDSADGQRAEELISIGNKEQAFEHLVEVISQYVHLPRRVSPKKG
jgi:hypothetical protein